MQHEFSWIRQQSLLAAGKLGYTTNQTLPLLDASSEGKSPEQVLLRLLCMHVSAACAFGFDRGRAKEWIAKEGLDQEIAPSERRFVELGLGNASQFQLRVEGMWALAWSLGLVPVLDFAKECDHNFVTLLPDVKTSQSSAALRSKVVMRPVDAQLAACDLSYCLHWSLRQAELSYSKAPGAVSAYVIIERRRALEWLIGSEHWDEVTLDT